MKSNNDETLPAQDATTLDRWLGRREAFGLVAGRCSAADVECLREIRDNKLYAKVAANWDEFCRVHLRSSRHRIDNAIRQLDEHGRPFFHATQMLRLTEAEYIAIKGYMTEDGVLLDGELISWNSQNTSRVVDALGKLRAIAAPRPVAKPAGFQKLLERCDAVSEFLEKPGADLDDGQRRALGETLLRLSNQASRRGIVLLQR